MISSAGDRPRRVLVTGAGGFIGRHLVAERLSLDREVVATDLAVEVLTPLSRNHSLTLLKGDVADPTLQEEAVQGVETVFHLAAAHLSVSDDSSVYRRVNVDAVKGLVARCRDAGVTRFVHCSTVGVYGALRVQPADENTPCDPEFDYEKTKLEGEKVLLEAFRSSGFPVTILRPAWVYGPACPRTEKLFRAIRKKRFPMAGTGGSFRHSLYIRDMCTAFEMAATAEAALGQVIIIADDEAVTIRTLLKTIAEIVDVPPPRSVPFWALYGAGAIGERLFGLVGREPPLSRRSLRFFSGNTSFDTARARQALGFRPAYGIREGLQETFEIMEQGAFWTLPMPPPPLNRDR